DRNGHVDDLTSDPRLQLFDQKGDCVKEFFPVNKVKFSHSSKHLVLSTRVPDSSRNIRSKRALEALPMDTLRILTLGKKGVEVVEEIDSLRNFKLAGEADWIAFQRFKKDSTLHVRALADTAEIRLNKVSEYGFSKKGASLYWVADSALWVMNCATGERQMIKKGSGKFSKMAFDETGNQIAFYYSEAPKNALAGTGVSLWYASIGNEARLLSDSVNTVYPEGWVVSPFAPLTFSKQGHRLFFGTAPAPREKDTIQAISSRPNVQIWSYDEPEEYIVQETNKARDAKRAYLAMCQLADGKLYQIANKRYPHVSLPADHTGDWALLRHTESYSLSSMWEAAVRSDYVAYNLLTGESRKIREADYTSYRLSPSGRYAIGYAQTDSLWRSIDLATGESYDLTSPKNFIAWDE
ncbi:MAG: S9 family peptidase, partial [Bacteroidales bacterium]|nr:S9 family peptidase [Bacteroidales bacterium]